MFARYLRVSYIQCQKQNQKHIIELPKVAELIESYFGSIKYISYDVDNDFGLVDIFSYYDNGNTLNLLRMLDENPVLLYSYEIRLCVNGQKSPINFALKTPPLVSFKVKEYFQTKLRHQQGQNSSICSRLCPCIVGDKIHCTRESKSKRIRCFILSSIYLNSNHITFYHVLTTLSLVIGTPISAHKVSNTSILTSVVCDSKNEFYNLLQEESPILLNELEFRIQI
jgi:hypothetical protein